MTMQRLVETAQGTSAGMTQSMNDNIGLANARALRNGKSKKKKKKSVNKSNLGSSDHDALTSLNDDDIHATESPQSHSQDSSSRLQLDDMANPASTSSKRKKKKKKSKSSAMESIDNQVTHSQPSTLHSHNVTLQYKSANDSRTKFSGDNIWSSNNNSEERQRIREFWLQLGEDERRSLVKVEKEAVLKKMKEQQKHSCNCSVCGKKRTAIEEELEILYDAYYEELEQYANHQQSNHGYGVARSLQDGYTSMRTDAALVDAYANQILASKNPLDHQDNYDEDDDEDEDDDDDEDEDEDDEDYDGDYDDEDLNSRHAEHMMGNGDHFNFGNSLTVKGGILTVADDLLKNDGKKFLDMMERLAERRMQREEEAGLDQDEYYDDDDEDDDVYEDEVDEDTMTEEQRMEEGRRMFQIFAARMFEQRVLTAYREKIAQERQQRLLEELEEEDRQKEEREQKKLREKEKKKDKKRQLKKQKEEERIAKEAQRLAEEEKARIEKEKKLEEERQKREQERLKKEEEKRQKEEDRLRKEEEKRRRMKEEKDRLMEKERKRKEKEEKDRKEREAKERKEAEELMRKEAEEKEHQEQERQKELKMKEHEEQIRKDSPSIPSSIPPTQSLPSLVPTASQSTPSNHSSTPYAIKSGSILKSPTTLYSEVDDSSASLDTTLSLTPLAISSAPQPLAFNPLPNSPLSPVRSPSVRNHLPSSSLPVNPVFQDQDIDKPTAGVNSLSNHSMGVLPVGYPKRMSSQLESIPVKSITRPNIAPIGKPPGYRRKSASMGIVGGPMVGAERRTQPSFEALIGNEPTFSEALQVDSSTQDAVNESHSSPSFFSLFGDSKGSDAASSLLNGVADSPRQRSVPQRPWMMHSPQRSHSISGDAGNSAWPSNSGWGASSNLIEDTVQSNLFGDVMSDRLQLIVDRAKTAYMKLEELYTPTGHFPLNHWHVGMTFHPLFQLHRMYSDLFPDIVIDQQELLEACLTTNSGFNCINHPHQGYLLRYEMGDYNRRASLSVNGFLPSGPLSPSISGGSTMNDINFHQFTNHASSSGAQHPPPIPQPHFHPLPALHSQQQPHQQQPPQHQQQQQQPLGQGNATLFGGLSL